MAAWCRVAYRWLAVDVMDRPGNTEAFPLPQLTPIMLFCVPAGINGTAMENPESINECVKASWCGGEQKCIVCENDEEMEVKCINMPNWW